MDLPLRCLLMFPSLAGGCLASPPRLCPEVTLLTFCLEARLRGDWCAADQGLLLSMSPCPHAAQRGSCP